ncbi:MAG: hypothetical protein COA43_07265, partial [Robiginitomaculum sp.]
MGKLRLCIIKTLISGLSMKHALLQTSLLCAVLLLEGCASAATGSSRSALLLKSPAQDLNITAPKGSVLSVIRYPAVVETA